LRNNAGSKRIVTCQKKHQRPFPFILLSHL
jgi:hypothetical protein